jgi:hypothetical protein
VSQTQIDEIELRLTGVDHRPWVLDRSLYDENGRALICKGSKKSRNKAEWGSLAWDDHNAVGQDALSVDVERARNERDATLGLDPLSRPKQGRPPNVVDHRSYVKFLALFKLCDEATEDMAEFVAHAPQDVETLLNEVKFLRKRLRDAEIERDEFKKEILSLRIEKSGVADKLSDLRRTLREFGKAIKESGA